MKSFTMIERDFQVTEFQKYCSENDIRMLAYDFELESNLHVYGEKICLIQIYDGKQLFIIDPFRISRDKLAELLEDKKIVKLFYAADSDLSFAFKQYKIKVKSVFDLQIMVDLLEFDKKGLDDVLLKVLGVVHENKSKYQKFNWTVRPIKPDALKYALTDVEYLIKLNDELMKMVAKEGKTTDLLYAVIRRRNEFDSKSVPALFKSREYKSQNEKEKKRFLKIYNIRDAFARKINCPPACVLSKEQMFYMAHDNAHIVDPQFSRRVPQQYWQQIIDEIGAALKNTQ